MMKFTGLLILLVSLAGMANMIECAQHHTNTNVAEQGKKTTPAQISKNEEGERPGPMDGAIKELAVGSHCTVSESFVFVARDAETYQALESLQITLPGQNDDFFNSHVVIAAFLGQRRTGGFGIDITQAADGVVQIAERTPKSMVTQVLTTPFRIVALPVKADGSLALALGPTWQERWRNYRLNSGEVTVTGGFAGIHETSSLTGSLGIMRERTLATFMCELKSNGKRGAQLRDVVSGTVSKAGQIRITYLDSHSLSGAIQSPFKATGQFISDEKELSLTLETVSSPNVSDNFTASATLRATATTPRPANRALTDEQ